ncbi:aminotransferase class IV [Neosynechococcus sphagnicola]|uniref:aminotransferase class IV n=1 Tax=Neosynechococcus sphagnicola TaxID=1501145 RepID=UPI000A854CDC|nr:aminotransferase class IV [Neosynechococcus sphagnicola]
MVGNPPNWQRLRQGAETLVPVFPVLRIVLFPDGREWITGRALPADLGLRQQQGITAWVATPTPSLAGHRSLPDHKTGNYLAPWLVRQQAQQRGAQEAILVDAVGNWLETTTGNLWGWGAGQWWTPPLSSGILPGVVRGQLISWLTRHNERVGEIPWDPDWVETLEAIAYTNSVVELVPFHRILSPHPRSYPGNHPCWEALRHVFQRGDTQRF